jgi:sporulation protein YlmC with PRC-barrel domain
MTVQGTVDLALGLLDHQLLDRDERRCGKVDDLELKGVADGNPQVAAIVAGPPAWRGRGRVGKAAATVARGRTVRIPWEEVKEVGSAVQLRRSAAELGLGHGDDRTRPWIQRLPKSQ